MMKNVFCFLLLFQFASIYCQDNQEEEQFAILKHNGKIVFIDNNNKSWMTCYFNGDSVRTSEGDTRFLIIDNKQIVQVFKYPIPEELYNNSMGKSAEMSLLLHFLKYEQEYFEKELLKTKIKVEKQFIENQFGKNFLLWYYKVLKDKVDGDIQYQLYLSFTMNDYVGLLNTFAATEEEFDSQIKFLKDRVDKIIVYGSWIDINGIYDKIDAVGQNSKLIVSDTNKGFSFELPIWINKCKTGSDNYWLYNFPDYRNVKNALAFMFVEKKQFKNIDSFNSRILQKSKVNKRFPNDHHIASGGLSSKAISAQGITYYCHDNTFETDKYYVWVNFTATEETYEMNIGKFYDIIESIKIINK